MTTGKLIIITAVLGITLVVRAWNQLNEDGLTYTDIILIIIEAFLIALIMLGKAVFYG